MNKAQKEILHKFDILELNPMQKEMSLAVQSERDVILHSPTGTGKTLAFLLPLVERLDSDIEEIQAVILVPSRELAQQIEQVARDMGSGLKINAVYGGRSGALDKMDLKKRPAILIGTPGRVADRIRRDNFNLNYVKTLILDEFDKSLEVGFEDEMTEIMKALSSVNQKILTSATRLAEMPSFIELMQPLIVNHLSKDDNRLKIKVLLSEEKDKLKALVAAIEKIGGQPGIIFCNFKDALTRISDYLTENQIHHQSYHGSMEQVDRERALIKLRNGTTQLLLATDLAARGLDIPELKYILHYHLPTRKSEFTHRNGRTARMNRDGVAYILHYVKEELPEYIQEINPEQENIVDLTNTAPVPGLEWKTLYISGGRKDKISKGDIVGLLVKQGEVSSHQIGVIELKQNSAYVGVHAEVAENLVSRTNNTKLKKKKVRIRII